MKFLLRKLGKKTAWRKIFIERFTEPLHLNFLSLFVAIFGNFRQKVNFDLIIRRHNAFCLLEAARFARWVGFNCITAIEFGVGSGEGLLNIAAIAKEVTKTTGVNFKIYGFDLGSGLPSPCDYRDQPEIFSKGQYPMDVERVGKNLPPNVELVLGDIKNTAQDFIKTISKDSPIGFLSIDVDYYSSVKECLKVLINSPEKYLPITMVHLDDIGCVTSNPWVGELLAVNEFNAENNNRKIWPYPFLRTSRIFKNVSWIDTVYILHVLDHEWRSTRNPVEKIVESKNPYF